MIGTLSAFPFHPMAFLLFRVLIGAGVITSYMSLYVLGEYHMSMCAFGKYKMSVYVQSEYDVSM